MLSVPGGTMYSLLSIRVTPALSVRVTENFTEETASKLPIALMSPKRGLEWVPETKAAGQAPIDTSEEASAATVVSAALTNLRELVPSRISKAPSKA